MTNLLWEYMRKNGLTSGDIAKDRRAYIELAFMGDVDPYGIPLDAELEEELPEHVQLSHIMGEQEDEDS